MPTIRLLYIGQDTILSDFVTHIAEHCGTEWKGDHTDSHAEALTCLETNNYDIVVADASCTMETAVDLLATLQERWPRLLRYLITDATQAGDMAALFEAAHRVMPRPTSSSTFAKQLQGAIHLRELLTNDQLQARITSIKSLPCLPETYQQLVSELQSGEVSIKKVADLVSRDAAITAKLLQVVNSAFFGLSHRVADVFRAVNLVGLDTVRSLVLTAGVFEEFKGVNIPHSSVDEIYRTSVSVGTKSRLLAHTFGLDPIMIENAFLGGMLHDVGRLLMARCFGEEYGRVMDLATRRSIPVYQAEEEVLGASDAVIGAFLLSLWGIADPIVEAVALHYKPSNNANPVLGPLTAVHLGWAIDTDERMGLKFNESSSVDTDYLKALGMDGQVEAIRGLCAGAVT